MNDEGCASLRSSSANTDRLGSSPRDGLPRVGQVRGGGEVVVGGLAEIDVAVGKNVVFATQRKAYFAIRNIGDHLVMFILVWVISLPRRYLVWRH